jgi:hypothetical protein
MTLLLCPFLRSSGLRVIRWRGGGGYSEYKVETMAVAREVLKQEGSTLSSRWRL